MELLKSLAVMTRAAYMRVTTTRVAEGLVVVLLSDLVSLAGPALHCHLGSDRPDRHEMGYADFVLRPMDPTSLCCRGPGA